MKKISALLLFAWLSAALLSARGNTKDADKGNTNLVGSNEGRIFNQTGYPIVKEAITLQTIAKKSSLNGDFNQMPIIQELEAKTGITLDILGIPAANYEQKINLQFASGDLPDFVLAGMPNNLLSYTGEGGYIRAIEGYVEKYMPKLLAIFAKRPEYRRQMTRLDGHMYNLPSVQEYIVREIPQSLFINTVWLKKLNLQIPKTTEEYYRVLRAFKSEDPNGNGIADEIPLSVEDRGWWPWRGMHAFTGAFMFPFDGSYLRVRSGKVAFEPIADAQGFREFVKYYQRLYREGLLDLEAFTQDQSTFFAKGRETPAILGSFIAGTDENVVGAQGIADYAMLEPLKGPKGKQGWVRRVSAYIETNKFFLTSANPYPASTMRMMDLYYDPYYAWQLAHGPWDVVIKRRTDGKVAPLPLPEGLSGNEWRFQNAPAVNIPYALLAENYENFIGPKASQRKAMRNTARKPYLPPKEQYVPQIIFTAEENDELTVLRTDILDYFTQTYSNWVTGDFDVDAEWPGFERKIKKIGLLRYLEIYQAAYQRYMAN